MNLTSFAFLVFAVISIIVYYIVPRKLQWMVLLVSSTIFLFYNNFSIYTLIQALLVLITTYVVGLQIDKNKGKKRAKYYLWLGIAIIIGLLFYLKYSNLFRVTFNHVFNLFNINLQFNWVNRISLIGLSYYSLIMISYLVDIYWGTCKAQKNIFKLALFMTYFPILPSGPFIRYKDMEEKLYTKHKFSYDAMCRGLLRVLWGLFKILVISQRLNIFVNTVYGDLTIYKGTFTILGILFFTLQLYTNFSGSIDIIMGVSEILNISLPENFTAPFFSKTITEFWRNWHITLGAWLRDYIFYPLMKSNFIQNMGAKLKKIFGKKFSKKVMLYLPMFIMWLAIGMWHGGAYTFILGSGLLQFLFIVLEDFLSPITKKINKKIGIKEDVFSYKLYQVIRTYLIFSFTMIFFRAGTVTEGIQIIKNIFVWNPWVLLDNTSLFTAGLDLYDFRVLIISLVVLFVVDYLSTKFDVREKLFSQNIVFRWGIIYLLIFAIVIFGCYGLGFDPAEFIYRQF